MAGKLHGHGAVAPRTAVALAEAAEWGMLYQRLTEQPNCAEECDDFGMMPLHWACTSRDVQLRVARKLVEACPVAARLQNKGGLIPLQIAIKAKAPFEVLDYLVGVYEDSVCVETPQGATAAELAEEFHLPWESIVMLRKTEDALRESGRAPPRPLRYRPFGAAPPSGGMPPRRSSLEALPSAANPMGGNPPTRHLSARQYSGSGLGPIPGVPTLPPLWKLDKKCSVCHLRFSYFKSRHHCRNCGASVCATHSNHHVALPHIGLFNPQRVCIMCFDDLRAHDQPPSAVVNMYSKTGDGSGKPSSQVQGDAFHRMLSETGSSTENESWARSSGTALELLGTPHAEVDVDDSIDWSRRTQNPNQPPRSTGAGGRRRADTDANTPDQIQAFKHQIQELQNHERELQQQKQQMREGLDDAQARAQDAIRAKGASDVVLADLRDKHLVDLTRVPVEDSPSATKKANADVAFDFDAPDLQIPEASSIDIAATRNYLGLALMQNGDYQEAVAELRKSVQLNSQDADAWCNLGRALFSLNQYEEAEVAMRVALDLRPKNYTAMAMMGRILQAEGNEDRSIQAFRDALAMMEIGSESDGEDVGCMTVGW